MAVQTARESRMCSYGAASFSTADSPECVRKKGRETVFELFFADSVLLHKHIAALRLLCRKILSLRQTPNLVSIEVVPRAQPAARRPAIFEWLASNLKVNVLLQTTII